MKIIEPHYIIMDELNGMEILKKIEQCGRTCYLSEDKITDTSCIDFAKMIIKNGHESVLEHVSITVKFIIDRGVSHEIVRHRIASFSQESTRYCNYSKGGEIGFIKPSLSSEQAFKLWQDSCEQAESTYLQLLNSGCKPQEARAVLPNCLKTEIVMTANLREWRHFLRLRTSLNAHPDMRKLVIPLLIEFKEKIPVIFDDILIERGKLELRGNSKYNSEGYYDPTTYEALKPIVKEEAILEHKAAFLIKILKFIINETGFKLVNRIEIEDKKTGRYFK
jgi:thymidylate synthase (FAD)